MYESVDHEKSQIFSELWNRISCLFFSNCQSYQTDTLYGFAPQ